MLNQLMKAVSVKGDKNYGMALYCRHSRAFQDNVSHPGGYNPPGPDLGGAAESEPSTSRQIVFTSLIHACTTHAHSPTKVSHVNKQAFILLAPVHYFAFSIIFYNNFDIRQFLTKKISELQQRVSFRSYCLLIRTPNYRFHLFDLKG